MLVFDPWVPLEPFLSLPHPIVLYYRANLGVLRVIALMFCLFQELFTFFILQETGFRRGTCAGPSNFLGVQVTWSQLVVLAWCLSLPLVTHLPSSSEDPAGVYGEFVICFWCYKRSRHFPGSSLLLGSRQSCLPFGPCVKNEGNVGTNLQKEFRTGVWKKPYIVLISSPQYWIKNIYFNCHLLTA